MSFKRWCCVLVALLGVALPVAAQSSNGQFLRQPLVFEPNRGQADPSTKFLSHGNGHSVLLKNAEAVITFSNPAAAVRMKLVGQNPRAVMEGLDLQPGVTNYIVGNDPAAWRSSVPQFAKVKYGNVYPGIDLIYYGNERQLEYDFAVSPHANPSAIQMEFEGADQVSISPEGDLVLRTRAGEVRHQRPVAYQTRNGVREPVDAHFVLKGKRVRFEACPIRSQSSACHRSEIRLGDLYGRPGRRPGQRSRHRCRRKRLCYGRYPGVHCRAGRRTSAAARERAFRYS